jgi:hypothetical protein
MLPGAGFQQPWVFLQGGTLFRRPIAGRTSSGRWHRSGRFRCRSIVRRLAYVVSSVSVRYATALRYPSRALVNLVNTADVSTWSPPDFDGIRITWRNLGILMRWML